jgi:PPK2 family polyphosphate:nucleotide phosphotransferase
MKDNGEAHDRLQEFRLSAVVPGETVALGNKAARLEGTPEKKVIEAATRDMLERLAELQDAFHADGRHALLLILQGRDAAGKDGLIKTVYGAFSPTGVKVAAFGPPTPLELRHDFLWRVHQVVPPRGMIGVFNRSHYEDVLAVRVRKLAPEAVWSARFEQINHFESMLHANGVVIRKCFLHISQDEQRERLLARLDDPRKNWKFRLEDLDDRALWDEYTDAYRDVIGRCSTPDAPWYVVPADEKPMRNYLVARLLVETLESLHPTYPAMKAEVRDAARGFR